MATPLVFRSTERVDDLAGMAIALRDGQPDSGVGGVPEVLADRARLLLLDLFGVTLAGSRTAELVALRRAWLAEPGSTSTIGRETRTTVETAMTLDAIASCCLELDEGNKYAAGHPAAHVVPAAVAAARLSSTAVSGATFIAAIVAGYEVAARFGHALTRDPRWHTHGHWGAAGAATAASIIGGGDAETVAAAIDSSTGLVHVTPWAMVLDGDFTRNLWIAGAARGGLDGARLASAGLVHNSGAVASTLGDIVGSLDLDRLTSDLEHRWLVVEGYAKRHASCSYTHAAVDTVQNMTATASWTVDDIDHVLVQTHSLAAPLFRRHPTTRLGAMFSLPFVVAAALSADAIDADALDPDGRTFTAAERLSDRVTVEAASELDALLPRRRAATVTVTLRTGERIGASTPNPVGDVDHFPMDRGAVEAKLRALVGTQDTAALASIVDAMASTTDVAVLLAELP